MQMKDYLKDSARTAAAPKVHLDLFENHAKVLHQALDCVHSGHTADAIKRSLFYGDQNLDKRLNEHTIKMKALYLFLEEKPDGVELTESQINLLHGFLGLSSESGEMMEELITAKVVGRSVDTNNIIEECGDIMWYLALILREVGSDFETIARKNIAKLKARYPEKFTSEDAINRNLLDETKALNA